MNTEQKRKQSFLLRLPTSVREQATQIAHEDGTSLNHFISLAVADRISRMERKPAQRMVSSGGSLAGSHLQLHRFGT